MEKEKKMEVFILTERKKSPLLTFIAWFSFAVATLALVLTCLGFVVLFIVAVLFAVVGYFILMNSNVEYECSYFGDEIRFARIKNKSKRKRLQIVEMDSVITIAPAGDRSLYNYDNDKMMKVLDYTSGLKDVPYYEIVVKNTTLSEIIKVELDDKFLDEISKKYRMKVVRKEE